MIEKLVHIINILFDKTSKKEAEWSTIEDGFLITLNGKSYFTLQKYNKSREDDVYVVNLYNDDGKRIAWLDTEDNSGVYPTLLNLYNMIYDQYHKIGETLDDLLNALSDPSKGKIGDKNFNPHDDDLPF